LEQLVREVRHPSKREQTFAELADGFGRDAVGDVCGYRLAARLVGRGRAELYEGERDGVLDESGVGLRLLQFVNDEAERLRKLRRALGVILYAARRGRTADAVRVCETSAPSLDEDAVRAAARIQKRGEVVE